MNGWHARHVLEGSLVYPKNSVCASGLITYQCTRIIATEKMLVSHIDYWLDWNASYHYKLMLSASQGGVTPLRFSEDCEDSAFPFLHFLKGNNDFSLFFYSFFYASFKGNYHPFVKFINPFLAINTSPIVCINFLELAYVELFADIDSQKHFRAWFS